jgi:hypothetical protein
MVMAWAFLLIMVAALLVTNFQQQSFSLFEWGFTTYERIFGPVPTEPEAAAAPQDRAPQEALEDNEGVRLSEAELEPWILKIWAGLALLGWLLGLLRSWLFGPREPMSLGRKLAWAALAAAVCSALCFVAWLFGSESFHGGPAGWIALFTGAPALVWCVSAWALSIGHLLDALRRIFEGDAETAQAGHGSATPRPP